MTEVISVVKKNGKKSGPHKLSNEPYFSRKSFFKMSADIKIQYVVN